MHFTQAFTGPASRPLSWETERARDDQAVAGEKGRIVILAVLIPNALGHLVQELVVRDGIEILRRIRVHRLRLLAYLTWNVPSRMKGFPRIRPVTR
jgi:hypothetical protein